MGLYLFFPNPSNFFKTSPILALKQLNRKKSVTTQNDILENELCKTLNREFPFPL